MVKIQDWKNSLTTLGGCFTSDFYLRLKFGALKVFNTQITINEVFFTTFLSVLLRYQKQLTHLVCVPDWSPSHSVVTEHDERSSIKVQF